MISKKKCCLSNKFAFKEDYVSELKTMAFRHYKNENIDKNKRRAIDEIISSNKWS